MKSVRGTTSDRRDCHLGRNLAREYAAPQVRVVDVLQVEVQRAEAGLVLGRHAAAPAVQLGLHRARLGRRLAVRLQGGEGNRLVVRLCRFQAASTMQLRHLSGLTTSCSWQP
jgi:hypothetical protein